MKRKLVVLLCLMAFPQVSLSSNLERVCKSSDRAAATGTLCGCIQDVADLTLSAKDQKTAVKFFKDPELAQAKRQSDRASDEDFWARYKQFTKAAQQLCG